MSHQLCTALLSILTLWLGSMDANMVLDISPPSIAPGVTKTLEVNCTFPIGGNSNVSTVFSIILSKSTGDNNTNYVELVSINAFDANHVTQLSNISAVATGHLGLFNDPYLSLKWTNPTVQEVGHYKCTANGMDQVGHPVMFSTSAELTSQGGAASGSCNCQSQISSLQSALDKLQLKISKLQVNHSELFTISATYNGHKYYISKQYWRNADVAEASCEAVGGYLAEIDNAGEYQFIKDFLQPMITVDLVLVGATDEYIESQWDFRYSKKPAGFLDWFQGEPDIAANDCMVLYGFKNWKMHDFPCYNYDLENRRYFLCEVPA